MLTEDEKTRTRHHLGYLAVQEASTFVLGLPSGAQTQFVIEGAWSRLLPQAEGLFRKILGRLDLIEQQIEDDTENVAVDKLGDIEVRPTEFQELMRRYQYWRRALANMLGVMPNPYDQRFLGSMGGGVNVPVRG